MNEIYQDILRRVEKVDARKPAPLRREITELLVNHPAVQPHDECPPVSDKVARYKLANGASIGHEFQSLVQNWWISAERLPEGFASGAEFYPAGRDRSSNVKCIPDVAMGPAYKVALRSLSEAEQLVNALLAT